LGFFSFVEFFPSQARWSARDTLNLSCLGKA
jgi:hypothetical protein